MRELMNCQEADAPQFSENSYLLLDGAGLDAPCVAYSLDDEPHIEALFQNTRHQELVEVSPWLVKPSPLGKLFNQRDIWSGNGVVLRSTAPFGVLADHLRSLLSVKLPQGELAYCRFYSPEWASRLFSTMTQEEFARWSGPIQCWVMASGRAWHRFTNPFLADARRREDEGWFTLRIDQIEDFNEGERQRFVDRAMEHLRAISVNPDSDKLREEVHQGIELAQSYGFEVEHQIMHFLELRARFPTELASTPWIHHLQQMDQNPDLRLRIAEQKLFGLSAEC